MATGEFQVQSIIIPSTHRLCLYVYSNAYFMFSQVFIPVYPVIIEGFYCSYGALAEKLGIGLQNLVDGSVTRTRLHPGGWRNWYTRQT